MVVLSKALSDEEKTYAHKRLCEMAVIAVFTQNVATMAETAMLSAAVNGDSARLGTLMASSSSAAGLVEFVLNPLIGKMSDDYGRKWVYYIGPVLSGIGGSLAVLATAGKNLPVLFAHKVLAWSSISMSMSFIGPVTISDMFSGPDLGIKTVQMFGKVGLGVTFAPALGSIILSRTGSPMRVIQFRLACALAQLFYVQKFIPETLLPERQRPFKFSDVSLFGFLKLFKKSHTLRVLAGALFFNCCVEGKNLVPLLQTWMTGHPLKMPIGRQAIFTTLYGLLATFAGTFCAPKLMKNMGGRAFTSLTNVLNTVGLSVMGLPIPNYFASFPLGMMIHGPGINNTSAAAIKAVATDHAVANGIARGEYGGMYSSLRTLSMIIAPALYGWAYKRGTPKDKLNGGFTPLPFIVAAIIGGFMPELLHRSLTDEDMKVPEAKPAPAPVSPAKS